MKKCKILFGLIAVIVALVMSFSLTTYAAIDSPVIGEEDLENATGNMTDRVENTYFGWPFAGGDKSLHIADINDAASKDYVIEGNKSLYIQNIGETATADLLSPITAFDVGGECDFSPDKTYVVRFLLKQINPFGAKKDNFRVIVRTWSWEDPWVEFTMKADSNNDLKISVTQNAKIYEKAAIQKIADNTYEVALRFNGVPNTTNNYLAFYLEGKGGFSIDGLKIYESSDDPKNAFEKTAVVEEVEPESSEDEATDDTSKDETADDNDNATDSDSPEGLSRGALIAIIVAGVVVLGCGAAIAVYFIVIKKKKSE